MGEVFNISPDTFKLPPGFTPPPGVTLPAPFNIPGTTRAPIPGVTGPISPAVSPGSQIPAATTTPSSAFTEVEPTTALAVAPDVFTPNPQSRFLNALQPPPGLTREQVIEFNRIVDAQRDIPTDQRVFPTVEQFTAPPPTVTTAPQTASRFLSVLNPPPGWTQQNVIDFNREVDAQRDLPTNQRVFPDQATFLDPPVIDDGSGGDPTTPPAPTVDDPTPTTGTQTPPGVGPTVTGPGVSQAGSGAPFGFQQNDPFTFGGPLGGFINQALGANQFLLGPSLFPGSNPALAAQIEAAIKPLTQRFQQTVLPNIRGEAITAGGFGGSRQGIAEGIASRSFLRSVGDVSANISSNAFQNSLQAMVQALGLAPQTANLSLLPPQLLESVGAQRRAFDQGNLSEEAFRFISEQLLPFATAQDVAALAFGIPGGRVTSVSDF